MFNYEETDKIELKEKYTDTLPKEIVSFLNANGGTIVIGITKDKKVIGIKNDIDGVQRKVSDVITDQISPRCIDFVNQHVEIIEGLQVVVIDVLPDNKNLYYIKKYGLSENGVYVRNGSSCKSLLPNEIKARYLKTLNIVKPTIEEMTSKTQKLTFNVLKIYLDEKQISYEKDSFAETFKLLDKDGKYNEMAYLLSDQFDESIKVCRFKGDGGNLVMRKEFGKGCIFKIFNEVKDYMQSQQNIVKTYFDNGIRRDEYLYNQVAFVEAWKNAILHNDYAERQYPQIYLYDDRLEVLSHGYALKNDTLDEFIRGVSRPINLQLAKIALNLDITDQTGKGNKDIVRTYGKEAFDILDNTLIVKIPYNALALENDTNDDVTHDVTHDVTQGDLAIIIELIRKNPKITREEMALAINKTTRTVQRILNKCEYIEYVGSCDKGHWVIK